MRSSSCSSIQKQDLAHKANSTVASILNNLGPRSRQWLAEIGVFTIKDLRAAGSITTYKILKDRYPKKVSPNLQWGLEAAIRDMDWRELTEIDKEELKKMLK